MKRLFTAFAAAFMAISLVPALPAEAASKTPVDLVTQHKSLTDGSTTKYTYNKNGLVKKEVYTNKWTDVSKEVIQEDAEYSSEGSGNTSTETTEYAVYGTRKSTDKCVEKQVTKFTYYTKGKAKGKLKKCVTVCTYSDNHKMTCDTNSDDYDTENSGSYKISDRYTVTRNYSYNKKGVLKKIVTTQVEKVHYTYSNLKGCYATEYPAGEDSVYRNGASYKDDVWNTVITTTFKTKGGLVVKTVGNCVDTETDVEVTDGVATKDTYTKDYGNEVNTYKYNKGYLSKWTYKSSGVIKYTDIYNVGTSDEYYDKYTYKDDKSTSSVSYTYNKNHSLKGYTARKNDAELGYASRATKEVAGNGGYTNTVVYSGLFYVTNKTKAKVSYEYVFKGDSNRILEVTEISGAYLANGDKDNSKTIKRAKCKVKSKKLNSFYADLAESQQYALQYGCINNAFDLVRY
ncbi:MAG: hypothetical protein K5840_01530 [Eubacterium sp.]|nr:hypothetical protein [Eubacterium sp.]